MFINNYSTDYDAIKNKLFKDKNNKVINSIENLKIIFDEDKNLVNLFGIDERTDSYILLKNPPWKTNKRDIENVFDLRKDVGIIHMYLNDRYGFDNKSKLTDFVSIIATQNYIHPIKMYLDNLQWDGVERIETLFIDYIHALDNWFNRSVTKKTLIGAVAKIYEPGHSHDTTIILSGKQGCGKSLILKKLGKDWFNDSMENFKGDETYFKMAKSWIIELSELTAYNNSDIARIKQVLTSTTDTFRDKYAGESSAHIRDCIFFGTTNDDSFLVDETGNRRFIPMKVGLKTDSELNIHDLTDKIVDQIWAEAKYYYLNEETNHLNEIEKEYLYELQKEFKSVDEVEQEIAKFIIKKIPLNWDYISIEEKREFIKEYDENDDQDKFLSYREKICAREVREVLFKDDKVENKNLTTKINLKLKKLLDKEQTEKVNYKKYYGQQRGFNINKSMIYNLKKNFE